MSDVNRSTRLRFLAGSAAAATALVAPFSAGAQTPVEVPLALRLDPATAGTPIAPGFFGLALESSQLADPTFLNAGNTSIVGLIRRLGDRGILRIGGASLDRVLFTNEAAPAGSNRIAIGRADIARLGEFLAATGWQAYYGVNLATADPSSASDEAAAVSTGLGARLAAFGIGNEPDRYAATGLRPAGYGYPAYLKDFEAYKAAMQLRAPAARFVGPDVASATGWVTSMAHDDRGVSPVSRHYYPGAGPDDATAGISTLLAPDHAADAIFATLGGLAAAGTPFRITETGAVAGGGKLGLSNTFAAALWALDFAFRVAAAGGSGVNFEAASGTLSAPWVSDAQGTHEVRPLYYGLLFFSLASRGRLVSAQATQPSLNLASYAVRGDDGSTLITLINKDTAQDARVTIDAGAPVARADVRRLSAPAVDSIRDVKFAGSPVGLTGNWSPQSGEHVVPVANTVVVRVPFASAALVTIGSS